MLIKSRLSILFVKKASLLLLICTLLFTLWACQNDDIAATGDPLPSVSSDEKESDLGNNLDEEVEEEEEDDEVEEERIKVRALYLTGWTMGIQQNVDHFVELAKKTVINTYVIDIKDEDGYVGYESDIPKVREIGGWKFKYNADKVIKELKDNDIYVIGRLVCFKDPVLSSKYPEWAVKTSGGDFYRDKNKATWVDPYRREAWPYIIAIAKEALEKGFDEIQFDYIRFPNDGKKSAMKFNSDESEKHQIINEFISYARQELPDAVLSADVFGIILESPADVEQIGQHLELVGKELDYISPMIYPSHYALNQKVNGVQFAKPDLDPYGVVYQSLVKCKNRLSEVEEYRAAVRPYLQDFTASWLGSGFYQKYGPEQVREQIKAVYDAGYEEWIFWNAGNKYSEEGYYDN